jgi:hypothetical protein
MPGFRRFAALLTVFVAATAPHFAEAAPIVSAPFVTVGVGDTFSIDVSAVDAVDLTSFQFDLSFDPSILQANVSGAAAGASLPGDWFFGSPGFVDNAGGNIFGVAAFGSALNGAGPLALASIEFTASATGVSPLTFSNVFFNLFDTAVQQDGQVTVAAAAPEPATLALVSGGLALFALGRQTRQRRRITHKRSRVEGGNK